MVWSEHRPPPTLPPDWPAIRAAVLERDGYRCQLNGPNCQGRASEVHHIRARASQGSDHPSNLTSACHACHDAESKAALARMNAKRYIPAGKHPGLR